MERIYGLDACVGSGSWPLSLPPPPAEWETVEAQVQTGVCPFCKQILPLDGASGLLIAHTRPPAP